MISRQHFINKILALGYHYKRQAPRILIYKKSGSTHRISIPRCDNLEDEFVESALQQAGCKIEEIRAFISSSTS